MKESERKYSQFAEKPNRVDGPVGHGLPPENAIERKQSEEALKETEEQYRAVVQLSPAGILIHADGKIQFTNPALARMLGVGSQEKLRGRPIRGFLHPDYRDLVEERIRRITLDGKRAPLVEEKFLRTDRTAIDVKVTSFPFKYRGRDAIMAVVEDITPCKRAEEALRHRERELEEKSVNLEDANTALKVVLSHMEKDKRTLESTILGNIKELVFPYIERLRSRSLTKDQMACLVMIESNLNEVISPFLRRITAIYANFTPTEIQIANLIKNGRTNKEIADILKVGTGTVHTHRNNIRSKLGVRNKDINLRSYLLSLQE